jgi:hypothetical protein
MLLSSERLEILFTLQSNENDEQKFTKTRAPRNTPEVNTHIFSFKHQTKRVRRNPEFISDRHIYMANKDPWSPL